MIQTHLSFEITHHRIPAPHPLRKGVFLNHNPNIQQFGIFDPDL